MGKGKTHFLYFLKIEHLSVDSSQKKIVYNGFSELLNPSLPFVSIARFQLLYSIVVATCMPSLYPLEYLGTEERPPGKPITAAHRRKREEDMEAALYIYTVYFMQFRDYSLLF